MTLNMYDYNTTFYTGTEMQPDVLHVFVKSDKKRHIHSINAVPLANLCGIMPILSCFTGLIRIINAVKIIFKELAKIRENNPQRSAVLQNAFKNLVRGCVEIIPLTGLGLMIFDAFQIALQLKEIDKSLQEKEYILGVAVDKKVIFTIDFKKFDTYLVAKIDPNYAGDPGYIQNPNEYYLKAFELMSLSALKRASSKKEYKNTSMEKVFLKAKAVIERHELYEQPAVAAVA